MHGLPLKGQLTRFRQMPSIIVGFYILASEPNFLVLVVLAVRPSCF